MCFYRERADQVLETAKEVVKALSDADAAQEKAQNAIIKANTDISLAKDDLEQVNKKKSLINEFF